MGFALCSLALLMLFVLLHLYRGLDVFVGAATTMKETTSTKRETVRKR